MSIKSHPSRPPVSDTSDSYQEPDGAGDNMICVVRRRHADNTFPPPIHTDLAM